MTERVLIVGATSAIAEHLARCYAADGARLALAARSAERCADIAADLRTRGAPEALCLPFDAADRNGYEVLVDAALSGLGGLDVAVIAHGSLPDQAACEASVAATLDALDLNAMSVIGLLVPLANAMAAAGRGSIAVISSVAGDRGRQSNYVYGAAKGCLNVFLEGLAHRLHPAGVRVLTVKPGLVDTPMTAAFDKGPLWARPERVARDIHRAIARGATELYTPWFWRWIMLVIRAVPRPIFFRTKL